MDDKKHEEVVLVWIRTMRAVALAFITVVVFGAGIAMCSLNGHAQTPNFGPNIQYPQPPINPPVQSIHPPR